jgi:hypothetical protein
VEGQRHGAPGDEHFRVVAIAGSADEARGPDFAASADVLVVNLGLGEDTGVALFRDPRRDWVVRSGS